MSILTPEKIDALINTPIFGRKKWESTFSRHWRNFDAKRCMSVILILGDQYGHFIRKEISEQEVFLNVREIAEGLREVLDVDINPVQLYGKLKIMERLNLIKPNKKEPKFKTQTKYMIDKEGLLWYPLIKQFYLASKQLIDYAHPAQDTNAPTIPKEATQKQAADSTQPAAEEANKPLTPKEVLQKIESIMKNANLTTTT